MDSPSKKRRFWQLHLSTAVLLTLEAAGLLCANLLVRNTEFRPSGNGRTIQTVCWITKPGDPGFRVQGWPMDCYWSSIYEPRQPTVSQALLIFNSCAALIILAASAFVLEWYIRRRESKNQPINQARASHWKPSPSTVVAMMLSGGRVDAATDLVM